MVDFTAVGETLDTTARLQGQAAAGEIVLSDVMFAPASQKFILNHDEWPAVSCPPYFGEGGCSMKITEDVRKHAAEHGLAESDALESGMQEKGKEFLEQGAEVYART